MSHDDQRRKLVEISARLVKVRQLHDKLDHIKHALDPEDRARWDEIEDILEIVEKQEKNKSGRA